EVAHEPRKTAEHEVDRNHADAEHRLLQLARVALELRETLPQPLEVHGVEIFEIRPRDRLEHRLADDELADEVHELIDLLDRDADRAGVVTTIRRSAAVLVRASGTRGVRRSGLVRGAFETRRVRGRFRIARRIRGRRIDSRGPELALVLAP